jgi:hypothetical protein
MSREQLTETLRDPAGTETLEGFSHPIVKLTEEELTRVIGGFDSISGTSTSSVSSSASTCDGTKVCCR